MQTIHLEAESREVVTTGKLHEMRNQGWLPAVLYGGAKTDGKSILLKVNEKSFLKTLSGQTRSNVIIELKTGTETANVLIKELQRDVVTRKFLHVDFQRIVMSQKLEIMVPVHIKGESPGVKLHGGVLEYIIREMKISCLPKDIPAEVPVDVSKMEVGMAIYVKDLIEIPGIQYLADPNALVINVVAQKVEEEAPAVAAVAAAPTAAEPEVIKKGKKEEEGAAPAAGEKAEKAPEKPAPAKGAPSK